MMTRMSREISWGMTLILLGFLLGTGACSKKSPTPERQSPAVKKEVISLSKVSTPPPNPLTPPIAGLGSKNNQSSSQTANARSRVPFHLQTDLHTDVNVPRGEQGSEKTFVLPSTNLPKLDSSGDTTTSLQTGSSNLGSPGTPFFSSGSEGAAPIGFGNLPGKNPSPSGVQRIATTLSPIPGTSIPLGSALPLSSSSSQSAGSSGNSAPTGPLVINPTTSSLISSGTPLLNIDPSPSKPSGSNSGADGGSRSGSGSSTTSGGGGTGTPPNPPPPTSGSPEAPGNVPTNTLLGMSIFAANQPEQLDSTTDPKPPSTPPPTGTSCSSPPCQPTAMLQGGTQLSQAPIRVKIGSPEGWISSANQIVKDSRCLAVRKESPGLQLIHANADMPIFPNETARVTTEYSLNGKEGTWKTLKSGAPSNLCGQVDIDNALFGQIPRTNAEPYYGCGGFLRITASYSVALPTQGNIHRQHFRDQKVIGCLNVCYEDRNSDQICLEEGGETGDLTDLVPIVSLYLHDYQPTLNAILPSLGAAALKAVILP